MATSEAVVLSARSKGVACNCLVKDERGRAVCFVNRQFLNRHPYNVRARNLFRCAHFMAQDAGAQRNGVVLLDNRLVSKK